MTTEQLICTDLDTALKAISIANGYSFNITGKVYEWRDSDLAESDVPGIIWRDYKNEIDPEGEESHVLRFEIVVVAAGNTSPATVRQMVQDAITAFFTLENKAVFPGKKVSGCYLNHVDKAVERNKKRLAAAKIDCYTTYTAGIGLI